MRTKNTPCVVTILKKYFILIIFHKKQFLFKMLFSFLNSCCFCFKLHHGFFIIILQDTLRMIWMVVILSILFIKPSPGSIYNFLFDICVAIATVIQSLRGFLCLNTHFLNIHYNVFKNYMISKYFFISFSFIKMTIKPYLNCYKTELKHCVIDHFDGIYCVELVWMLFEFYLIVVIWSFCKKIRAGVYTPIGGSLIMARNFLIYCKRAIDLEVRGGKMKNKEEYYGHFVKNGEEKKY